MGAFTAAVDIFTAQGVGVIPTRHETPAVPMVKHPDRFGVPASRRLAENPRFQEANAAIWAGRRSRLTIVDIDSRDPAHAGEAIKVFGDTPLKVSTPSGGLHLYYRHAGEHRCIRLFGKSLPLDVLGSGVAVVPPSVRPWSSKKPAGSYDVLEGDLASLAHLPTIRPRSIPSPARGSVQHQRAEPDDEIRQMREGDGRDNALFAWARRTAMTCTTEAELVEGVLAENAKMAEPLPIAVAKGKAASAWRYRIEGRLIVSGDRVAMMDRGAISRCAGHPTAFLLLAYLRSQHSPNHLFAVVPEAVAPSLGQSHNTIRKARDKLVELGFLSLERPGGGGRAAGGGTPNVYRLAAT